MKSILILALIVALFSVANASYSYLSLSSGVSISGINTTSDNSECEYFALDIVPGTPIVQIDVTSSSSSYVSVTAGFNMLPAADEGTSERGYSFLFSDDNVINGNSKTYFLCSYDLQTFYAADQSLSPTTSRCSAFVPNMVKGGAIYVCISSYSSETSGTNLTMTNLNVTSTEILGEATTWTIPASPSSDIIVATAYKVYVPSNSTEISLETTSSSTQVVAAGLFF
jgi:hypothetical protein